MPNIIKKIVLVAALSVALHGCATVGTEISDQKISQIKKGLTTEKILRSDFGKPYAETLDSDGKKSLVWTYAHANGFTVGQGTSLSVKLDKQGVVENYAVSRVNR